jgi:hypothetical protein
MHPNETAFKTTPQSRTRRHGVSIVYVTISMVALLGFCSLAVDLARVQTAKTELEIAADAAARAAAANIANGVTSTQTAAYNMAYANSCDGSLVTINSINDVVFLNWPSMTALSGSARNSANAIEITARQTIPLLFGQAIGRSSATVHATSIAKYVTTAPNYPILSLTQIDCNGGKTDSWNSSLGSYASQSHGTQGSIAAGAEVTLNSPSVINGNIYYSGTAPWNNGGTYTGSETSVSPAFTATTPTQPGGCTALGGLNITGTTTLNSGNYSSTGININSGGTLKINATSGPVNLYMSGSFTPNGGLVTTTNNIPNNFHIHVTNNSNIQVNSPCVLYAVVDVPLASFTLNNNTVLFGSVIADYITLGTGSWIHYDLALGTNGGAGSTTISQVK